MKEDPLDATMGASTKVKQSKAKKTSLLSDVGRFVHVRDIYHNPHTGERAMTKGGFWRARGQLKRKAHRRSFIHLTTSFSKQNKCAWKKGGKKFISQ